jgi:DNA-binding response OmpR family regulator
MNVAETWQPPDWFASPAVVEQEQRHAPGSAGLRIVMIDGSDTQQQLLLAAARSAGFDCSSEHWSGPSAGQPQTALLFEPGDDLIGAARCLRALRTNPQLAALPALLAVHPGQLSTLDAALGFDDFVLQPCQPLEVRARIRAVAQRRRVPLAPLEEVPDDDGLQVDAVAHEARVDGRLIRMTAREFALFAYLRARPERVFTRQHLLERVWGYRYRGGPRTVDTHIGRLRLKFGEAFPIETVRSNGYRLRAPAAPASPAAELAAQDSSCHAAE